MRTLILAVLLSWPLTLLADFQAGFDAYSRGDFEAAVREWKPLAEAGHPDAQNNLGAMYYEGQGVAKDVVQAYAWATLAVAQGAENATPAKEFLQQNLSADQLAEGQQRAQAICAKIADCTPAPAAEPESESTWWEKLFGN